MDGRSFTWKLKGLKRNNVYAKFWGDKKSALWYVMLFSGVVNDVMSVLKLAPVSSHKTIIGIEGLCRLDANETSLLILPFLVFFKSLKVEEGEKKGL